MRIRTQRPDWQSHAKKTHKYRVGREKVGKQKAQTKITDIAEAEPGLVEDQPPSGRKIFWLRRGKGKNSEKLFARTAGLKRKKKEH